MSVLKLSGVGKNYFGNQVLEGVDLELERGEIHGLIGENGAGKSTLMNIIYGMGVIHDTGGYDGEMLIDGEPYKPRTPMEAMNAGVGMVHQEFMLIPGFTITENVKLNRENTKPNLASKVFGKTLESLDFAEMEKDASEAFGKLNLDIDINQVVEGLPVGYKQFVEIAREIDKDQMKVLIVDEPTAVLTESEAEYFLEVLTKLSKLGIAILFITHRLEEIKEVTDRITILRDGKLIKTLPTSEMSVEEMAAKMVGRDVEITAAGKRELPEDDNYAIEVKDLNVSMTGEMVRGIDLKVRKGEILGIGGLAGQGKIGIANGIIGLYPATGSIKIHGKEMPLNDMKAMLDEGVAFLSEDRRGVGLLLDESIGLNIAYTAMEVNDEFLSKVGPIRMVKRSDIRENALDMIERLDIRCRGPEQHPRALSGGNQQKVCIARALTFKPDILMVSEPTRGIDIGAKNLVMDTLLELNRNQGVTIIMTSSELAELRQISDRIAIVAEGKIATILPPDADDTEFGLAMAGAIGGEKE